jgi:phosphoserine phosphatase
MNLNKKKKSYKTVFFDWNKTLSNSLFWEQLNHPKHERHAWNKNISTYLFKENKPLISEWMKGLIDSEGITEKISAHYNYPADILLEDLAESCRNMKLVSDEIFLLIQKLQESGTKCVIATDNMDTFTRYTVPALKLTEYFDDIIVSFDKGLFKFDVQDDAIPFFDGYLMENHLNYKDVVLIDDCIDKSGTYEKRGFDILQVFSPDDFVGKLKQLALEI